MYCLQKMSGKNKCILDDIVNEFLEIAGDYDGFVFGTPVHWGGAGGAITSFMDRVFYADLNGGGDRFRLKPAAVVISARRAGTTATWDQVINIWSDADADHYIEILEYGTWDESG